MYMLSESPDRTDNGFLNSTLAYFNTNDFGEAYAPKSPTFNVTMCRSVYNTIELIRLMIC